MGAGDPSSGTASLHEVIRGFGALLKKGWKPLRTIIIASWDAEEVCKVCDNEILKLIYSPLVWAHRKYGMGRRFRNLDPEKRCCLP